MQIPNGSKRPEPGESKRIVRDHRPTGRATRTPRGTRRTGRARATTTGSSGARRRAGTRPRSTCWTRSSAPTPSGPETPGPCPGPETPGPCPGPGWTYIRKGGSPRPRLQGLTSRAQVNALADAKSRGRFPNLRRVAPGSSDRNRRPPSHTAGVTALRRRAGAPVHAWRFLEPPPPCATNVVIWSPLLGKQGPGICTPRLGWSNPARLCRGNQALTCVYVYRGPGCNLNDSGIGLELALSSCTTSICSGSPRVGGKRGERPRCHGAPVP